VHDAALEPAKHSAVVLASSDGASPPAGPRRGLGGARISGRAVTTPDGAPSVPTPARPQPPPAHAYHRRSCNSAHEQDSRGRDLGK